MILKQVVNRVLSSSSCTKPDERTRRSRRLWQLSVVFCPQSVARRPPLNWNIIKSSPARMGSGKEGLVEESEWVRGWCLKWKAISLLVFPGRIKHSRLGSVVWWFGGWNYKRCAVCLCSGSFRSQFNSPSDNFSIFRFCCSAGLHNQVYPIRHDFPTGVHTTREWWMIMYIECNKHGGVGGWYANSRLNYWIFVTKMVELCRGVNLFNDTPLVWSGLVGSSSSRILSHRSVPFFPHCG